MFWVAFVLLSSSLWTAAITHPFGVMPMPKAQKISPKESHTLGLGKPVHMKKMSQLSLFIHTFRWFWPVMGQHSLPRPSSHSELTCIFKPRAFSFLPASVQQNSSSNAFLAFSLGIQLSLSTSLLLELGFD